MVRVWFSRVSAFALAISLGTAAAAQSDEQVEADSAPGDDIVVIGESATTATKTDTPIIETPQAISVVPSELYLDRGARNIQETLRYSAGVTAEPFGLDSRSDGSLVRGLNPVEYLDGMRRIFNYIVLPRIDVETLDRVEVLRGPASVLYGQGANGGIVNMVSKRPEFTPLGGEVKLQYGSFDRKQASIDIGGQLNAEGNFAGRLVALVRDAGAQTDFVRDDRVVLAPSFAWRPGPDTEIALLGTYQRDRGASTQQFLPVAASLNASGNRRLDISTFLGDPDKDRLDADQYTMTLLAQHRFSDTIMFRTSLRFLDGDTFFQEIYPDSYTNPQDPFIDADDRVVNRFIYATQQHVETLTSDTNLQFDFATGPFVHKLLAGIDYTDFRQRSKSGSGLTTPIDVYDPVSTGVEDAPLFDDPYQVNTQLGFYLQDQIRYADRVTLVVGVRRDRAVSRTGSDPQRVDEATTFRAGLIGEIGGGVSPYVSYSEAFLPVAGFNFGGEAFVPQRGRQYEAGVKFQPMRGVLLTASVFDIEETNRPINDPDNVLNLIQTGRIKSRGIELEGSYVVPGDVTLTAAFSHNEVEVTESSFAPEVGVQLSDTPKTLASLWAAKTFALTPEVALELGGGVRHVGETLSTGTTGSLVTPSYTLADALASVAWRDWTLSINATNLFDKEYFAPCRAFGDCFTGNGRSVVGTLAFRF
ncbi:TonB-dependent siderophore receptor [Sphingomonas gilva]|uniref:TonB-dependent siderophore receptor n=2 Tax=Sphingomonas gilva TaxID=2305907 RepID=A0A396RPB5_9SPHN|nr:TonB-dependent siderophore receptor [Sphingomonas gilva]